MDCIFCKIVEGAIPSKKVLETDTVLAFHDIQPAAPVHVLLIPKRHIATMNDVTADNASVLGDIALAAQQVAETLGIKERGYRLVNNCNEEGGQVVYHLHFHLLGGEKLGPILG
ncbi:histidine triad nucleotide-binding protein [Paenibacillus sp.]|uniref:histidine triad nucleotide-binding protein n=1 Tax=Paenibacillus sp. TaxID=58172 RepID=UPI002D6A2590|nr:histidine triad nucleotide-binding protein [Paenibacillus sp.]HZG55856.1 histidine triad nucleotide-binding protein [Paenibacillus sp.]